MVKINKKLTFLALLVMLAVALYFSQNKPQPPKVESLQGLNEELNSITND